VGCGYVQAAAEAPKEEVKAEAPVEEAAEAVLSPEEAKKRLAAKAAAKKKSSGSSARDIAAKEAKDRAKKKGGKKDKDTFNQVRAGPPLYLSYLSYHTARAFGGGLCLALAASMSWGEWVVVEVKAVRLWAPQLRPHKQGCGHAKQPVGERGRDEC